MFGAGMLSVSGLVGCVYGPDPTEELKTEFAVNLEEAVPDDAAQQNTGTVSR